jgi:hypothetical protein
MPGRDLGLLALLITGSVTVIGSLYLVMGLADLLGSSTPVVLVWTAIALVGLPAALAIGGIAINRARIEHDHIGVRVSVAAVALAGATVVAMLLIGGALLLFAWFWASMMQGWSAG